jgi:hypothetical protein
MFPQQASRSFGIAGGRGTDHLDVVSLPVHLLATGILGRRSVDCAEISDGEPKGRIGGHCEFQRPCGSLAVDGSLGLSIPGGRLPVCRNRTAVLIDGWPAVRRLGRLVLLLASGVLHGEQRAPMV